jgi:hypothetical protein
MHAWLYFVHRTQSKHKNFNACQVQTEVAQKFFAHIQHGLEIQKANVIRKNLKA